ncbi:SMP-30/gluconolactonase/LRE family protein [Aestuariicella hydrocarbonica]|uniref:SMP-30/gluconolactonase/LRE family protein n=1 Tax=Pseudomaricurvus hydrocarbonicus TaxID=1470433 RepID=A0A9E5MJT6_9GAMM|nr:SMP-30/gluconolactonase/LRE family protein [Aestuariicella hydrocarbonica]NHO65619.1 SMP-30/gluconolactonase/LRE family protein [Aestuariicella hydrocarbonica]
MTTATIFDDRRCTLGEGVLWHPGRQQLFWFDIVGMRLMSRSQQGEPLSWQFDEHVSAAGWVDDQRLLIASASALSLFDVETGDLETLCALEADNPATRSNDGRADPWGGFWIGTMGKSAQAKAGAIYRYYRGELRQLISQLTIPNAICFSPDRQYTYFADTEQAMIWQQPLDADHGWPLGEATVFIDGGKAGVYPDGCVTDASGNLWNAQWGASRVACYNPQGVLISTIPLPAEHVTCPAFGGPDLQTLYIATATQDLSPDALSRQPLAGQVFSVTVDQRGLTEPAVVIR